MGLSFINFDESDPAIWHINSGPCKWAPVLASQKFPSLHQRQILMLWPCQLFQGISLTWANLYPVGGGKLSQPGQWWPDLCITKLLAQTHHSFQSLQLDTQLEFYKSQSLLQTNTSTFIQKHFLIRWKEYTIFVNIIFICKKWIFLFLKNQNSMHP